MKRTFANYPVARLQEWMLNADQALRRNNMTGAELLKLAYQAANTYANRHPTFPASRIEDLAMFCAEIVCRRADTYDPNKNPGFDPARNPHSTPFKSWCWLQMSNACLDFVRKRNEGFAGRIGRDKPITVEVGFDPRLGGPLIRSADEVKDDRKRFMRQSDPQAEILDETLEAIDELAVKRTEAQRWREAAARQGLTLEQFIREALDAKAAA